MSYPDGSKNNLPADHPERAFMVTLDASPNTYLNHPALGQLVIHEFDVSGNPLLLGFRVYQTDGTLGPTVRLGHTRDCTWRVGFHEGGKTVRRTTRIGLTGDEADRAARVCSQCGPGHDDGTGRCERHGKLIAGLAVDADDLAWARDDLGPYATEDEVYRVAENRADQRDRSV